MLITSQVYETVFTWEVNALAVWCRQKGICFVA